MSNAKVGRVTKCAKRLVAALLEQPDMSGTIDLANSRKEALEVLLGWRACREEVLHKRCY